jgi:hypothetical protein
MILQNLENTIPYTIVMVSLLKQALVCLERRAENRILLNGLA